MVDFITAFLSTQLGLNVGELVVDATVGDLLVLGVIVVVGTLSLNWLKGKVKK